MFTIHGSSELSILIYDGLYRDGAAQAVTFQGEHRGESGNHDGWIAPGRLRPLQREVAEGYREGSLFLQGPAGSGKTTAAVYWAKSVIDRARSSDHLLILVPQLSLAQPYADIPLRFPGIDGGRMTVLTLGGLARRMTELFWPMIAEQAGFGLPSAQPKFLTLETATYFLASTIEPFLEQGLFQEITLERNQLYRQILDNLNKAVLVGFPLDEIGPRLAESWVGPAGRASVFDDAMRCAQAFRALCLRENLLDFSLQVELFFEYILPLEEFNAYRQRLATHLLVDNVEEDTPRSHDLIALLIPEMQASMLLYDTQAGFRRFLGADPDHALRLKDSCERVIEFTTAPSTASDVRALGVMLAQEFNIDLPKVGGEPLAALQVEVHRHLADAARWVAEEIDRLISVESIPPNEIAVVAPYLSDSLRFMIGHSLEQVKIPWFAFRPSHKIRDEPSSRSILTLAAIAHPGWGIMPGTEEVARMLGICIADLDPVRADLLARILYHPSGEPSWLAPFSQLREEMQLRLTAHVGERYEVLRSWLETYSAGGILPLDHFLRRVFGEILAQPGFGFANDLTAGSVISTLVDSVHKFRLVLEGQKALAGVDPGERYLRLVEEGVVTAQDLRLQPPGLEDGVLIAPAYTFLMANRIVSYQFWLDVGSDGWGERIYQPLTHPYVLSRQWERGRQWTDQEESAIQASIAGTLALGLTRRCANRIYALWNEVNESGYEQRGPMLRALQQLLRRSQGNTL